MPTSLMPWQDIVTLETSLLAVLTTLVAALIWVTKALFARSERLIDARDSQISRALDQLEKAVSAFGRVESREDEIHDKIIARLDAIATTQDKSLAISDSILEQLRALSGYKL